MKSKKIYFRVTLSPCQPSLHCSESPISNLLQSYSENNFVIAKWLEMAQKDLIVCTLGQTETDLIVWNYTAFEDFL